MGTFRDDFRFDNCFFLKDQLEERLGMLLSDDQQLSVDKEKYLVSEILKPYLSRITIDSWVAACLIVNNAPYHNNNCDLISEFKDSILDAVKNGTLNAKNLEYDLNGRLCCAELYKNEVGKWAKKYGYNWPLPLYDAIKEHCQDNSELLQRIKKLEEELQTQTKINDCLNATLNVVPENVVSDNGDLEQSRQKNEQLKKQLNQAQKKIEELQKQVPILLCKYSDKDLLALAIKVRNEEWSKYDHVTGNGKASQMGIVTELQEEYKISEKKAKAIEIVACPIDRG